MLQLPVRCGKFLFGIMVCVTMVSISSCSKPSIRKKISHIGMVVRWYSINDMPDEVELEYDGTKQKVYKGTDVVDVKMWYDTIIIRTIKGKYREPNLLPINNTVFGRYYIKLDSTAEGVEINFIPFPTKEIEENFKIDYKSLEPKAEDKLKSNNDGRTFSK